MGRRGPRRHRSYPPGRLCGRQGILLTDEPFDANEALRINLINEVVPHDRLMARAEEAATHMAGLPPLAVRMIKEFVIRFRDIPVTEAWRVQGLMNSLLTQLTTDGDEGRMAFLEKRPPKFTGGIRQKEQPFEEATPDERGRLDEIRRELQGERPSPGPTGSNRNFPPLAGVTGQATHLSTERTSVL